MTYTITLTFEVKPDQMWGHRFTGKIYTVYWTLPNEIQCVDEEGYYNYFTPNYFYGNFKRRD